MMLDAMKRGFEFARIAVESRGERLVNARKFLQDFDAVAREGGHAQGVEELGSQASVGIAGNGDVIDVGKRDPRFLQAIADRRSGKAGCVFDTVETLFLHCGNQLAIADQRRRGITVIRINAENIHEPLSLGIFVFSFISISGAKSSLSAERSCAAKLNAAGTIHSERRVTKGGTKMSGRAENYPTPAARPQYANAASERARCLRTFPASGGEARRATTIPRAA